MIYDLLFMICDLYFMMCCLELALKERPHRPQNGRDMRWRCNREHGKIWRGFGGRLVVDLEGLLRGDDVTRVFVV